MFIMSTLFYFADIAQDLVRFLRKRDKRYKDFTEQQAKIQQELAFPSKAKPNQALKPTFVEQEWQKVGPVDDLNDSTSMRYDHNGGYDDGKEEEEGEVWECVACNKVFRSEAAWSSHERSRKHLKEVERYGFVSLESYPFHRSYG